MLRLLTVGFLGSVAIGSVTLHGQAFAQTCGSFPQTLTNGTTADASHVMSNFNAIRNCANSSLAPIASPALTGQLSLNTTAYLSTHASAGNRVAAFGANAYWNGSSYVTPNSAEYGAVLEAHRGAGQFRLFRWRLGAEPIY